MIKYTNRFAEALLDYAVENGLELVFRQALLWKTQLGKARRGLAQRQADGEARRDADGDARRGADGDAQRQADGEARRDADGDARRGADGDARLVADGGSVSGAVNAQAQPGSIGEISAAPPLGAFLAIVPPGQRESVLNRFIRIARDRLNVVDVEVTTAVPLTPFQRHMIEVRLIRMVKKQVNLTADVDPSLIGGVRIETGSIMMDDTIKRKLVEMKDSIEKGVYQFK